MKKRHETLLKAFGCFEQYKHTRLKVTKYSICKDSSTIPRSVIPLVPSRYLITSAPSTPKTAVSNDNSNGDGDGMNVDCSETQNKVKEKKKEKAKETEKEKEKEKEKEEKIMNTIEMETDYDYEVDTSCVKNSHRNAPHADPELQSEYISDEALLQEVHFNYGRAYSELKFYHLAVKHFNLALALADNNPFLRGNKFIINSKINVNNESNNGTNVEMNKNDDNRCYIKQNSKDLNSTSYFSHLQVTRECAHNLVLIYKKSGAIDQALEVMRKYLTF